jgi:hypothetical protein
MLLGVLQKFLDDNPPEKETKVTVTRVTEGDTENTKPSEEDDTGKEGDEGAGEGEGEEGSGSSGNDSGDDDDDGDDDSSGEEPGKGNGSTSSQDQVSTTPRPDGSESTRVVITGPEDIDMDKATGAPITDPAEGQGGGGHGGIDFTKTDQGVTDPAEGQFGKTDAGGLKPGQELITDPPETE